MTENSPLSNFTEQCQILSLLVYFDIFNHPLSQLDIVRLKGDNLLNVEQVMNSLMQQELCFHWDGFYSLQPEVKALVEKRKKAEANAMHYWNKIRNSAQRIANFPFVRGVAISGSLSKGVMTEDGDIDFFIITEPGKLWLARTLLILYKKIRLLNSKKYFCLNYFVDTNNLNIIDKNIFTAVEVAHLIPVYSQGNLFESFYHENKWVLNYLNSPAPIAQVTDSSLPFYWDEKPLVIKPFKRRLELMLNVVFGEKLEQWTHKTTLKRWEKKFAHFNEAKFELTMRSTKGVSKHHPHDFQSKVLDTHKKRLQCLIEQLNVKVD